VVITQAANFGFGPSTGAIREDGHQRLTGFLDASPAREKALALA